MRLLVTNARCSQAYFVLRALRPYADWVTVTMSGPRAMGFWPTCHAAYSRLVDRRVSVPHPEQDWHSGNIQTTNTAREQAFIDAVLEICERDKIDTIFPSNDPWVYVLSKNKELFTDRGIVIPIPDLETVKKPLDKYDTVLRAQEVGFPTPRSCLWGNQEQFEELIRTTRPPWTIKPRFTSGGRGLAVVADVGELTVMADAVGKRYGAPMIQEYIPGNHSQSFYIVIDKNGQAVSVFTPKVLRSNCRVIRNATAAGLSRAGAPYSAEAVALLRHIGWWGGATVQTKIDPRDGKPKLMEINPRLGQYLWTRTEIGINEPRLCLQIANGESPAPMAPGDDWPLDCLLLEPIADVIYFLTGMIETGIYGFRRHVLRRPSLDPLSPPTTVSQRLRAIRSEYFGKRKRIYHPSFRYLLEDPRPCLLWTSKKVETALRLLMKGMRYH